MLLSPIDDPFPKQSIPSSSVTYSRFRTILFNDLLDSNPVNRARALDNIVQIVTEWARVVTDCNVLADLPPRSFSNSAIHGNPTPPFSPAAVISAATCSIEGTLFPPSSDDNSDPTLPNAIEKLTISTHPHQRSPTEDPSALPHQPRARTDSSTSSSSPLASSPNNSAISSSTTTDAAGAQSVNCLSSSPLTSSSYHFQNDPDVHFNRALPDKLSPLEERVAEVDEAARLLRHHILTILRFSICCPYKDVKICLVGLLNELE
ncbi:hypothetical protein BGZ79_000332, partial [Entomortierella chlamydospora]